MAQATAPTTLINRPAWVDLATTDAGAARDFYSKLFGWQIDVDPDPQYGGYGMATRNDVGIAGIGGKQDPNQPNVWSIYIGTDDIDALAGKVSANGGTVVAAPFAVGDQGRMAVFQDPSGAFFSAWEAAGMRSFVVDEVGAFGWAEVNSRGVDKAIPFYEKVFGWKGKTSSAAGDGPPYTELQKDGQSLAGAWEIGPEMPAEVPSYWQIYFNVDDVDAAHAKALELGAHTMVEPQDFPGGRFAIVTDPQGAAFGLLKTAPNSR